MNAFVVFPSANTDAANAILAEWHELEYDSIVLVDKGQDHVCEGRTIEGDFTSFSWAANVLCLEAVNRGASWVVVAGDDIHPAKFRTAGSIAHEAWENFKGTMGIMQPTGDAYGALAPNAEYRAAVSPWIGAEFIRKAYGGKGPYHEGYKRLWDDGELREVAIVAGCYWENPYLCQYHAHWSRGHADTLPAEKRKAIIDANAADKALYLKRRAENWPGAW